MKLSNTVKGWIIAWTAFISACSQKTEMTSEQCKNEIMRIVYELAEAEYPWWVIIRPSWEMTIVLDKANKSECKDDFPYWNKNFWARMVPTNQGFKLFTTTDIPQEFKEQSL